MTAIVSPIEAAHELYRRGKFLQAHESLVQSEAFPDWSDPDGLMLAQRVAAVLGASRKSYAWTLRAHRRYPDYPLIRYYFARDMLVRRGPWNAWEQWRKLDPLTLADLELQADWIAFKGTLAAHLRDFDEAERCLDRALKLAPNRAWIWCERAQVFESEDRYDDALVAYQQALSLRPWYSPAVQGLAHAYELVNRDQDALQLLTDAATQLESGGVMYQLAGLQMELGHYAQARASLAQLDRLYPLCDKDYSASIAAMRSDAAYYDGDEPAAIEYAKQAGKGFFASVAEHLAAATPDAKRVQLPVGFVRQHHMTCAPATLTALGRLWNKPLEHVEISETICYDGTPAHSERSWAVQNGFVAREFTVDWETASALIERGIPFTFTTVEVGNSHLQGIIGYDARRGTLLVREPSMRRLSEILALKGLEHYKSTGPRGMTIVPQEEAARLDGIPLPDAELYDDLHQLDRALDSHDRAQAHTMYERMLERSADHRLTHHARRTLAFYDADLVSGQHAQDQLCRLFPDDTVMLYGRWHYLRAQSSRQQRLDFLAPLCARKEVSSLFRLDYVDELCDDARDYPQAKRELRRLSRVRWSEARVHRLLGNMAWSERRFAESTEHYRVAACLADKDERHAWTYFCATRQSKSTAAVLEWFESRCRRHGVKSSEPAQTLYSAYATLDRMDDAFRVLNDALRRRPDDGGLLLYAADAWARSGDFARAHELLQAAESRSHRAAWLQTAADIASFQGDLAQSLLWWQQLQTLQPQSTSAAAAIARLMSQLHGTEAAKQFLRELLDRFPHNVALLQRTVEWFRDDDYEQYISLIRRLIEANPVDGWARRELAIALSAQRKFDEALSEAELAVLLDPYFTTAHSVLASVLERSQQFERAQIAARRAIELSVDNDYAIYALMRMNTTHAERLAALEFVHGQLVQQTMYGDGVLAYVDCARGVLPGDEVLANLRAAHEARPDLWHSWSALVRELVELERLDEAAQLARESTERFSLLPGAWVDLAQVCFCQHDLTGEVEALEHAVAINPVWGKPLQRLADAYQRQGDLTKCRDFIQQGLRRNPNDAVLHGYLADVLWSTENRVGAIDETERAVRLDIDYAWAWGRMVNWSAQVDQPQRPENVARDLIDKRPQTARAWYWLGRVLQASEQSAERRAAYRRAIELNPLLNEAYVYLSRAWRDESQIDAALEVCRNTPWGEHRPADLRIEEARIIAASGNISEAIALASAITTEHGDEYEAWNLLTTLCLENSQEKEKCLEAATALTKLAPHEAGAWAQLADARRWNEDIAGAKSAYHRAMSLSPSYEYATNWLFDLEFEAEQLDAAGEVLEHGLQHSPSEFLRARAVQYWAKRRDLAQAQAAVEQLLKMSFANEWPLQAAIQAFTDARWADQMFVMLREATLSADAHPQIYEQWVKLCVKYRAWEECQAHLRQHAVASKGWFAGAAQLLNDSSEAGEYGVTESFAIQHANLLHQDSSAWGMAGCSLVDHDPDYVIGWMSDWRERNDLRPWMLSNLGTAFEREVRYQEAAEVRRATLDLPEDYATQLNRILLAADEIILGNWDAAQTQLQAIETADFDEAKLLRYYQCVLNTVRATLSMRLWWSSRKSRYSAWQVGYRLRKLTNPFSDLRMEVAVLGQIHKQCRLRLGEERSSAAAWILWLLA